jgi:hypothetical protein
MVRAQALRLSALWHEQAEVGRWRDRAVDAAERLSLGEVFGSESFHGMVAGHAGTAATAIRSLLARA